MNLVDLTKASISEVMETMFFTVLEFQGEEDKAINGGYCSWIRLTSEDSQSIFFIIKLEPEFAKQITADFLGFIPDNISENEIEDCAKELANMLGGTFIAKAGERFNLGLPSFGKCPEIEDESNCTEIPMFVMDTRVGTVIVCSSK